MPCEAIVLHIQKIISDRYFIGLPCLFLVFCIAESSYALNMLGYNLSIELFLTMLIKDIKKLCTLTPAEGMMGLSKANIYEYKNW